MFIVLNIFHIFAPLFYHYIFSFNKYNNIYNNIFFNLTNKSSYYDIIHFFNLDQFADQMIMFSAICFFYAKLF